jgi:hypothetical protein
MPGLLRGVARTAVVAGTATAVSNRVSRRQANRWAAQGEAYQPRQAPYAYADQQQAYAEPPPAPPATSDRSQQIEQLKELADLKAQGILTEEEFAAQKAQILGG